MANLIKSKTPSDEKDLWGTDWGCFYDAQHLAGRKFSHDVCAEAHTAKCDSFWTKDDDALSMDWPHDWWCNPPFSLKMEFIRKARESQAKGVAGVMLLPYEPLTAWWRANLSHDVVIYEPDGRYNFLERDGVTKKSGVNFGSVFVLFPANRIGPSIRVPFQRGVGSK